MEENGVVSGINLMDVLEQVKKAPAGTRILEVHISSPGGFVEEGDAIHDYLESEQKNYVVNTVQDGPVASIATKIWSVGIDRKADPAHPFLIHNPWNDPGPGDANYQAENLEMLLAEEGRLRKFYSQKFNISEEGLKPLMDQETTIPAKTLLNLGIATSVKNSIKVMAMNKPGNKPSTLAERAARLFALATGKAPAAAKAFDVELADGKKLAIDAADLASAVGAPAMLDGNPAPDGDYPTKAGEDGKSLVVSVSGGKVASVADAPAASAAPGAQPPVAPTSMEGRLKAMEENQATIAGVLKDLVAKLDGTSAEAATAAETAAEAKVEARIMALKKEIGTTHQPKPAATVYASTVSKDESGFKKVNQRLAEIAERNKSKRN